MVEAGIELGGGVGLFDGFGVSESKLVEVEEAEEVFGLSTGDTLGETSSSSFVLTTFFLSLPIYFLKKEPTLLTEPEDLSFELEEEGETVAVGRGAVATSAVGATETFIASKAGVIECSGFETTVEASNCCWMSDTSASKSSVVIKSRTSRVLVSVSSIWRNK